MLAPGVPDMQAPGENLNPESRECVAEAGGTGGTGQSSALAREPTRTSLPMVSLPCLYACSPGAASVRGPGQLVGEVSLFEAGGTGAAWLTSVLASKPTTALRLTAAHLRALLQRRPEAEAAVHAGTRPCLSTFS